MKTHKSQILKDTARVSGIEIGRWIERPEKIHNLFHDTELTHVDKRQLIGIMIP